MGIIDRATIDKARQTGTLYLSHLNLKFIPEEVFTMTNLVRLDLGWNHLEEISPRIGELAKLEELWLNRNPLKTLPVELESSSRMIDNIYYYLHVCTEEINIIYQKKICPSHI